MKHVYNGVFLGTCFECGNARRRVSDLVRHAWGVYGILYHMLSSTLGPSSPFNCLSRYQYPTEM